mmetsp:Transcript_73851/g.199775  ORF Transcript_73851/g.199775 Transcript_73851/m.199775 type:complete len:222 (+) Transcript_73851:177-842(+)
MAAGSLSQLPTVVPPAVTLPRTSSGIDSASSTLVLVRSAAGASTPSPAAPPETAAGPAPPRSAAPRAAAPAGCRAAAPAAPAAASAAPRSHGPLGAGGSPAALPSAMLPPAQPASPTCCAEAGPTSTARQAPVSVRNAAATAGARPGHLARRACALQGNGGSGSRRVVTTTSRPIRTNSASDSRSEPLLFPSSSASSLQSSTNLAHHSSNDARSFQISSMP